MKPQLQTSLGQQLVLTPQLRQAIKLLQMSAAELEAEISEAVETNPLLEWAESAPGDGASDSDGDSPPAAAEDYGPAPQEGGDDWMPDQLDWQSAHAGAASEDDEDGPSAAERQAEPQSLADHLLWQLHLSHLSARDRAVGVAIIDALDDDGYLREDLDALRAALLPEVEVDAQALLTVLRHVQHFDPIGIAARTLGECLTLQLETLPEDTEGLALAQCIAQGALERLPRIGIGGLAKELRLPEADVDTAVQLLRSLDPRPGKQLNELSSDTYVTPDCVVWRQRGQWRAALAGHAGPPVVIHRGYENLIRNCGQADAAYLRSHLQEARWLLKSLQARGDTLLRVVHCLIRQQAAFLEYGDQALRPLTLREVASELELHESTISRAIARKYVRTPRGTLPLRAFFASGVDTGSGGEASSTAIQSMMRRLIEEENPRKPLSDAKLADLLKAAGIPVARRTVAKYREAMNISPSHERVRIA